MTKILDHWNNMKRLAARQQTEPMNCQYESWHIKKPLMGRIMNAT
jgi:hypothetical protein